MAKLAVTLLILVHVHHSIVMMLGEVFQVKVVAAAKAAGITFFDHQGEQDKHASHENDEALQIEEIDYCSRNFLLLDPGTHNLDVPLEFLDHPKQHIPLVYFEIITPPPQIGNSN